MKTRTIRKLSRTNVRELLVDLKSARRSATMETASCGKDEKDSNRINQAVNLHHKTWIIAPLDNVIEYLERTLNGDAYNYTSENY